MYDIKIDQGERVDLEILDDYSVTATILVSQSSSEAPVIMKSGSFSNGIAKIELLNQQTDIEPGDYVYQIRLFDADGEYFNISTDDCDDDDCTMASFIVCPSIEEPES